MLHEAQGYMQKTTKIHHHISRTAGFPHTKRSSVVTNLPVKSDQVFSVNLPWRFSDEGVRKFTHSSGHSATHLLRRARRGAYRQVRSHKRARPRFPRTLCYCESPDSDSITAAKQICRDAGHQSCQQYSCCVVNLRYSYSRRCEQHSGENALYLSLLHVNKATLLWMTALCQSSPTIHRCQLQIYSKESRFHIKYLPTGGVGGGGGGRYKLPGTGYVVYVFCLAR